MNNENNAIKKELNPEPKFKIGDDVWAIISPNTLAFSKVAGLVYEKEENALVFKAYWIGSNNNGKAYKLVFATLAEAEEALSVLNKDLAELEALAGLSNAVEEFVKNLEKDSKNGSQEK